MTKNIRAGVYGLVYFGEKIVSIKKTRGPYTGLLDLPGGKIECFEGHQKALARELGEELGLDEVDFQISELLSVEEEFIKGFWDGENRTEHILAIIYKVKIISPNFDINYVEEEGGDAGGILLVDTKVNKTLVTPIFTKILKKISAKPLI